jgi:protein ImuB
MSLIAALRIADFALKALWRVEPGRRDEPLALVKASLQGGGAPILVISAAARALGVEAGMTVAQARAVTPELVVVTRDETYEASARDALRDVAHAFSPRLEIESDARQGWAFLDIDGLERLIGPPEAVGRELSRASQHVGLEAAVGVARTRTLARLAATAGDGVHVVSRLPTMERAFVAKLPLQALEPEHELLALLGRLGIRTVAELLALPAQQVSEKLGRAGLALVRRARGDEEDGGLVPTLEVARFIESTCLDFGLDNLEPLLFILRGIIDRLLVRLSVRGLLCGDLHLIFGYDGVGGFERIIKVCAPSRDARALLALCRLGLSEAPPQSPVVKMTVEAVAASLRPVQLSFFEPVGPAPDKLAVTVARLVALCGEDRIGAPEPVDTYRDDRFVLRPFVAGKRVPAVVPQPTDSAVATPPTTLRRVRPPQVVEVIHQGVAPVRIEGGEHSGRIMALKGPFRRGDDWWEKSEVAYGGDAYDAQLESGLVVRLLRDPRRARWLLVGCYD